jgi:hypothetical protein
MDEVGHDSIYATKIAKMLARVEELALIVLLQSRLR